MAEDPFYSVDELYAFGFSSVGRHVLVSRLARFYGVRGALGDYVRIDDFTTLKGCVEIGSFVHLSAYCLMSGVGGRVIFHDMSTTAAFVAIYTASDDYASPFLTNSIMPSDLKRGISGDTVIGEGVVIGTHAVVLPNSVVEPYATIGAHCIVKGKYESGGIYVTGAGRPRCIGHRDLTQLRTLASELRRRYEQGRL